MATARRMGSYAPNRNASGVNEYGVKRAELCYSVVLPAGADNLSTSDTFIKVPSMMSFGGETTGQSVLAVFEYDKTKVGANFGGVYVAIDTNNAASTAAQIAAAPTAQQFNITDSYLNPDSLLLTMGEVI